MKLSKLLSNLKVTRISGSAEIEISGISEDSRTISQGFLFFARQGHKTSGLRYLPEALRKGAVAIVSEEQLAQLDATVIQVPSIAEAESKISACFYGFPSTKLRVVGVTGTNGKTTFTYLLEAIANAAGWRTGVIGTINYRIPKENSKETEILPAPNTTPNPLELQRILALMRDRNTDLVVMEVSSHALELGRVEAIDFDGAVFTNLTQDHLDFHKTMENYFLAKAKLFASISPKPKKLETPMPKGTGNKFCIINADDPYGKRMASFSKIPVKSYGIQMPAEFMARNIFLSTSGSSFHLLYNAQEQEIHLSLLGQHNVSNALAAAAAATELGISLHLITQGLGSIQAIPGRAEPVICGQDFTVLVDYAHTEDALKNILQAIQPLAKKKILTLFGCGGDRDRSKRPLMGAVAAELSDWVVITSDNPRSEDPRQIALDIEVGIQRLGKKNYEVILDREEAIKKILELAGKDDMVLVAGKGHETYQIFADRTIEFDDRKIIRKILSEKINPHPDCQKR